MDQIRKLNELAAQRGETCGYGSWMASSEGRGNKCTDRCFKASADS